MNRTRTIFYQVRKATGLRNVIFFLGASCLLLDLTMFRLAFIQRDINPLVFALAFTSWGGLFFSKPYRVRFSDTGIDVFLGGTYPWRSIHSVTMTRSEIFIHTSKLLPLKIDTAWYDDRELLMSFFRSHLSEDVCKI